MAARAKGRNTETLRGDPRQIAQELERFRKSAQALSSRYPRLVDAYPKQWVAVHNGKVKAHAKTLDALLTQVDKKKLPRDQIIVRYIDKTQRTMIL